MVEAALREDVATFVQESIFTAYADAGDAWVDEGAPSDDGDLEVLRAVLAAERTAATLARVGGRAVTLRFGLLYSEADSASQQMLEMIRRRLLPVFDRGTPFLHVSDAAYALGHALNLKSGIYNVCDDEPLQWSEYLRVLARLAGAPPPFRLPSFIGAVVVGYPWAMMSRSIRLRNHHFKSLTGWKPRYGSARDGWRDILTLRTPRESEGIT
jgi:nucleoside-diphosphate-sugar epimerase